MITEVIIVGKKRRRDFRLTYLDFPITKKIVRHVIKEAKSIEVDAEDSEFGDAHGVLVTTEGQDGVLRRFGVAKNSSIAVLVVADELEEESSVKTRASMILRELEETLGNKDPASLTGTRLDDLVASINEYIIEHRRIALFGDPGTGKSSIFSLASDGIVLANYVPTKRVSMAPAVLEYRKALRKRQLDKNAEWYQVANRLVMLYDLPGIEEFRGTWKSYLTRADVGLLVLKSTKPGVIAAKKLLSRNKAMLPDTVIAIANFQDTVNALPPVIIGRFLGVTTYGMVATDPDQHDILQDILKSAAVLAL